MAKRTLVCCVCAAHAGHWEQHWNRDTGFGVCVKCVTWLRSRNISEAEILDLYGKEGVNWGKDATAWTEVSEERYDEMLGCLPPAIMTGFGFMVGEPFDHDRETGRPRYEAFVRWGDKCFVASQPMTIKQFQAINPNDVVAA